MAKSWKLTAAQRHQIAQRYAAGESGVALAKEFGVTPGNVSKLTKTRKKLRPHAARIKRASIRRTSWAQRIERLRSSGKLTEFIFPAGA